MKCYINANGVTTRACQKSQQYAPKGQKLIAQGNTLGKSIANHYAPLQGVLLFSIRTPKALPWAMCFWGFQPVLFDF